MTTSVLHRNLASVGRWQELSLVEQLGNIGSEVGRAIAAHRNGNAERSARALDRALELFDLTIADQRWRYRLKEITRAREVCCEYFFGKNSFQETPEALEKYFTQFALVARRGK